MLAINETVSHFLKSTFKINTKSPKKKQRQVKRKLKYCKRQTRLKGLLTHLKKTNDKNETWDGVIRRLNLNLVHNILF